jgi:hypothetical protein
MKKKMIQIPKRDFIKEHKNLINLLNRLKDISIKLENEKIDQSKELKKETRKK